MSEWQLESPQDVEEMSISRMQEAMVDGRMTSLGLTLAYLERIAKYDRDWSQ